ncbi:hypothetical protein [Novosphingobium sp. 9U]|uniref:hypothetical protein n=1 Tax=Novosphingobium sp. 9U TaxID=2653158 RepID=UPI001915E165
MRKSGRSHARAILVEAAWAAANRYGSQRSVAPWTALPPLSPAAAVALSRRKYLRSGHVVLGST